MDTGEHGKTAGSGAADARVAVVVVAAADERRVASVLESVSWAALRLVVGPDVESEAAAEACRRHGTRGVSFAAVPSEIAGADVDWVLLLEGHEIVPPALSEEILAIVRNRDLASGPAAYRIERRVSFLGSTLRGRSWGARERVRLARVAAICWRQSSLLSLAVSGSAGSIGSPLLAEPYASLRHYVVRMDLMTQETARLHGGRRARAVDLVLPPLSYILRAIPGVAARDGLRGLMLALLEAYALAVTCAKRWELDRVSRSRTAAR